MNPALLSKSFACFCRLAAMVCLLTASATAVRAAEPIRNISSAQVRMAARSPSGAFHIEIREKRDARHHSTGQFEPWVVPEKPGSADPEPLDQKLGKDDRASATYAISPDERWIFAQWANGALHTLFEKRDGLHFARVNPQDPGNGGEVFDTAMWDFCRKSAGLKPASENHNCTFITWSPDSARLLFSLSVEIKGVDRQWKVYWNTRERDFELTPFLTELNTHAYDVEVWTLRKKLWPFCAEPVAALPPIEALNREFKSAQQAFDDDWNKTGAAYRARAKVRDSKGWPRIEEKAAKWRKETLADIEKDASEFSDQWPVPQREQWRQLSFAGGLRAMDRLANDTGVWWAP